MILTTEHVKICMNEEWSSIPSNATDGSAGFDLKALVKGTESIGPNETKLISAGFKISIPKGYCGIIVPRSGLSTKKGIVLANTVGVIDSDYRGTVMVALKNISDTNFNVESGLRIAQMLFLPIIIPEFEVYPEADFEKYCSTERHEGGFGSTGES